MHIVDLNSQERMRNRKRFTSIGDAGWAFLIRLLTYTTQWNDQHLIKVDPFNPLSESCNVYGDVHDTLTLSDSMGLFKRVDRDLEGSKSIFSEG